MLKMLPAKRESLIKAFVLLELQIKLDVALLIHDMRSSGVAQDAGHPTVFFDGCYLLIFYGFKQTFSVICR